MSLALFLSAALAKPPEMPAVEPTEVKNGDLKDGEVIDLMWAQSSAVACFPMTQATAFNGTHTFFRFKQKHSHDLYFRLTPTGDADVSLYAMQTVKPEGAKPPNIEAAWRCHKAYYDNPGQQEVLWVQGYDRDFDVLLAVVGAKGAKEGAYKLEIWDVEGRKW